MIKEIHIIHHSHTDFGYTDLPSTLQEQQVRYLSEAIAIARKTEKFPSESKFRWTCEVLLPVADFLAQATPAERRGFDRAFANGQIELCAMAAVMSGLMWAEEFRAAMTSLQPLLDKYRPKVAFQNDITGMPWGMLPPLRKAGARYVWMGMNRYSGIPRKQRPALWWWEGPDGVRTLTYLNYEYTHGYDVFFPGHWRRGPVPQVSDVWYHAPEGRDTWDESPAALKAAHAHCHKSLHELFAHWSYPEVAVQVTNQWRFDNDPPSPQLPNFVRAWNAAGLLPKLRLSTPATFMGIMEKRHAKTIPVERGDWQDWWDDGAMSMPTEVLVSQRAKRLLVDLRSGRSALRSRASVASREAVGWREALLFSEHTFAAFDSVPLPYSEQTCGHAAQTLGNAYRAMEQARMARMEIIREAPDYLRSSEARHMAVLNPGAQPRSGWAELRATALRFPTNAARDVKTGEIFPLEERSAPQWSEADPALPRPFEVPDDAWNFGVERRRIFLPSLAAGETRTFEWTETAPPAPAKAALQGRNPFFNWNWNPQTGRLLTLSSGPGGSLIDPLANYSMGEPVIERPQGFGVRSKLMNRSPFEVLREVPKSVTIKSVSSHYSARFVKTWDHPNFHRIEQTWDFFYVAPIAEIETTFWFKEVTDAQAVLLAFPLQLPKAKATYRSMGWPTEVGKDQLPDSCGEHVVVDQGVEFTNAQGTLALATPDTPTGCFEAVQLRSGRKTFTPKNAHFFSMVSNSYWMTNFYITKAAKVTVRHRLSSDLPLASLTTDLWTFPCVSRPRKRSSSTIRPLPSDLPPKPRKNPL
jgi:hypothetical protein